MRRLALAALGLTLGCGRSELTIPATGLALEDASEASDANGAIDAGAGMAAPPDDAAIDVPPIADDAELFSNTPPDTGANTPPDANAGASDGSGVGCGPATCGGCCAGDFCDVGSSPLACGTGGQACVTCGPELSCPHGVCR